MFEQVPPVVVVVDQPEGFIEPTEEELPSPTPPSPPASTHYSNPAGGCMIDEVTIQIQGVTGSFCSPKCGPDNACPTDIPPGVTASPQCALKSSADGPNEYCALICATSLPILDQQAADSQCGGGGSCKEVAIGVGLGLCTYAAPDNDD